MPGTVIAAVVLISVIGLSSLTNMLTNPLAGVIGLVIFNVPTLILLTRRSANNYFNYTLDNSILNTFTSS